MTPRKRLLRYIIWLFGISLLLILTAVLTLSYADWNYVKPWLNQRTSEAIDRPFRIDGDLSLSWQRGGSGSDKIQQGWRRFVPWPYLQANDVHIGNPMSLSAKEMATMQRIRFGLNPLALLRREISVPVLELYAPVIQFERDEKGNNNWTFPNENVDQHSQKWKLDLQRLVLAKGQMHVRDALKKAMLDIEVDTTTKNGVDTDTVKAEKPNAADIYGLNWRITGSFNGEKLSGEGRAGDVLSLTEPDKLYPIDAKIEVAKTNIAIIGTIQKPTDFAELDLRLKVSGVSMARLFPILGVPLPETPAFSTEGRLVANVTAANSEWRYEKFTGKVGSSDIGGTFEFHVDPQRLPRPLLEGKIVSRSLNFPDLEPVIGADSDKSKKERGSNAKQPKDKALPVEQFKTERWSTIDANIFFEAEKIIRNEAIPLNKINTHVILKDRVLSLMPLDFEMAGGKISANIKLDAGGQNENNTVRATMKVSTRHLQIKDLFPTLKIAQASIGEINGDAALSSTGNSISTLLAASNGEIKTLIDHGTISKLLLEEMGLNVGNIVVSRLFGDKQVQLRCMASTFVVKNGVMQTEVFIIDTDEALINIDGSINLSSERLDLTIRPESKGLRLFSLRSPLHVRGNFKQPDVAIDKGIIIARITGAAALAALAPIAALIPLVNAGTDQPSTCPQLLRQTKTTPEAPAPRKFK